VLVPEDRRGAKTNFRPSILVCRTQILQPQLVGRKTREIGFCQLSVPHVLVQAGVGVQGRVGPPERLSMKILPGKLLERATSPYTLHTVAIHTPACADAPLLSSQFVSLIPHMPGYGTPWERGAGPPWSVAGFELPAEGSARG